MTSTPTPAALLPDDMTWFELREPGCTPERKGPMPPGMVKRFLRELFAARPEAYITVITMGHDGPLLQDGPECLQMLDGRSMAVGRRHIKSSAEAHADRRPSPPPSGDVEARLLAEERDFAWKAANESDAKLAERWAGVAVGMSTVRLALTQTITQERELRKAAEGERDEALRTATMLVKKGNEDVELMRATASTISSLKARAEAAEAQLAQLRKDAVEVVKPFAEFAVNVDDNGWKSSIHREPISDWLGPSDFRAARIFLNANDQGTNDGR